MAINLWMLGVKRLETLSTFSTWNSFIIKRKDHITVIELIDKDNKLNKALISVDNH